MSTLPPLWRDSDGFNEIASTFAPKGIIHWLPGYCLGGRLIVFAGSTLDSLLRGHGVPYLSISITPLSDTGIYTLLMVQHLFVILSLFFAVRTLSDHFPLRVLFAGFFALTPWVYVYANCIGSEAFSNPLVYLIAACGWNCLRTTDLNRGQVVIYFGLLLAAALTRQINALLAAGLPLALLPLAARELILRGSSTSLASGQIRYHYTRRLLISVVIGVAAIASSVFVQQTMCWLCRVPFRSTFGETFMWRLSYLQGLPEQERTAFLARISAKAADPIMTEALDALNQSLDHGEKWTDMYLFYKIDEILLRSGWHEMQHRTWQIDRKLNRIATSVLLSGDPHFLHAVWTDFVRWPSFAQADLARTPFELTDWLQTQLPIARYGRLRGLASFQHEEGNFVAVWKRTPYFHLFDGIPMLEMVYLTMTLSGVALIGASRDGATAAGVSYAAGLAIVAILIALANCGCTFFAPRFYLPVYSVLQVAMLLSASLTGNVLIKRCTR
ncbi:MAG: hypothetical protein JO279_16975 [Verrucomicrobia bacterium]|nr:hypothetical protein [Verrucomicrobiota bacterium]